MTQPAVIRTAGHDPERRGRSLGTDCRERIQACWAGYERVFAAAGLSPAATRDAAEAALEHTEAWAPSLAREIAGIAGGAGLEPWHVAALNARTEILALSRARVPGECSAIVFVPRGGGPPRTLQTWDWYEHLRDLAFGWEIEPRPGHVVRTFTEFGIVGKIGVNGAGLGLHFNILHHASDGGGGVPVHVVARRILDEAATIDQAAELARSAALSASTVLTVVAYDGERAAARCLELSPAGVAELPVRDDGLLLHTNHFLAPDLAAGERYGLEGPGSWDRLAELERRADRLRASADETERAEAMLSHREDGAALCCHPEPGAALNDAYGTLATISLDVAAHRLRVRAGGPCAAGSSSWVTV